MGRPSKYTHALAVKICTQIAKGVSLRKIAQMKGMPSTDTIITWNLEREEFSVLYARARRIQVEIDVDDIRDIADEPQMGEIVTLKKLGRKTIREVKQVDMLEHRRLRIDARKWTAGKRFSKLYGDKVGDESGQKPTNQLSELSAAIRGSRPNPQKSGQ